MDRLEKILDIVVAELKEIRSENAHWKEEIAKLKEEANKNELKWQQTVKNLEQKFEGRLERKEKQEKKNNIIIKGLPFVQGKEKETVENLIQKDLHLSIKPKEILVIGKDRRILLVKLHTWQEKQEIMKKKSLLKEKEETKKIFITNDYTTEEMKAQKQILEIAGTYQKEGKRVKIAYKKLRIEDKWWF